MANSDSSKDIVFITGVKPPLWKNGKITDGNLAFCLVTELLSQGRLVLVHTHQRGYVEKITTNIPKEQRIGIVAHIVGDLTDNHVIESLRSQLESLRFRYPNDPNAKVSALIATVGPFPDDPFASITTQSVSKLMKANTQTAQNPWNALVSSKVLTPDPCLVTFSVTTVEEMAQRVIQPSARAYAQAKLGLEKWTREVNEELQNRELKGVAVCFRVSVMQGSRLPPNIGISDVISLKDATRQVLGVVFGVRRASAPVLVMRKLF